MKLESSLPINISQPQFSVIIPTHNRPKMLERALRSLIEQSYKDFEVIVINDGSTASYESVLIDNGNLINRYIEYVPSKGVSFARNKGILESKGRWTVFLDDDDEFSSDFLKELYQFTAQLNNELSFVWAKVLTLEYSSSGEVINKETTRGPNYYHEKGVYDEFASSIGASYGVAINKEVYSKVGLFDTSFVVAEDTEFIIRMLDFGVDPNFLDRIGVIKHNHVQDRLAIDFKRYSEFSVYERILDRHDNYFSRRKSIRAGLYVWAIKVHYINSNFSSGDRLLWALFKSNEINYFNTKRCFLLFMQKIAQNNLTFDRYYRRYIEYMNKLNNINSHNSLVKFVSYIK